MDWGTHVVLAAKLLESCSLDKGAAIYSVIPVIDKEPPHFHRVYAHILENQPDFLDVAMEVFNGSGTSERDFSLLNRRKDEKIKQFSMLMNAGRIVVNTPSSQGAVGGIYNMLHPSLTLGCGTGGKNITTDNVTASHLLNIQRIARRRENQRLKQFDLNLYYDESLDAAAIARAFDKNF